MPVQRAQGINPEESEAGVFVRPSALPYPFNSSALTGGIFMKFDDESILRK